jgi:hypothetical protein
MRRRRFAGLAIAMLFSGSLVTSSASGLTVGDVATTDPGPCSLGNTTAWFQQVASVTAQYVVPSAGIITSWSTSFGPAGAPVELVASSAFSSASPPSAVVRGVDAETLPNPIPAGNVSTFTLAHPIGVQSGDLIGLHYTGGSSTRCLFTGASGDNVLAGYDTPNPGGTLAALFPGVGIVANVSVNIVQTNDLALAAAATPSAIVLGDLADFRFQVSGGPATTASFTETIPAGLVPVSASAVNGSCGVSGQSVICALNGVPTTVDVVVQGSSPGMYTDSGHVTSPLTDTNPGNNTASAMLGVVSPAQGCVVAALHRVPLTVAKSVLRLLHCRVGKVHRAASRRVPKGDVISTTPAAGTIAPAGTKVAITVSSGRHHH